MTMETPEQIARYAFSGADSGSLTVAIAKRIAQEAIEADRAQRDIIAQIAGVLDDRGAHAAAQLVRDTDPDDDLWNNYIGPMIDSIEDDYTGMAKEINA